MERAGKPALQVGEGAVHPGQQHVRRHGADRPADVPMLLELAIACQAVADDRGAALDHPLDEAAHALAGPVGERFEAHPARVAFLGQFNGADDQQLAHIRDAVRPDRVVLRAERDLRLVFLDQRLEQATVVLPPAAHKNIIATRAGSSTALRCLGPQPLGTTGTNGRSLPRRTFRLLLPST